MKVQKTFFLLFVVFDALSLGYCGPICPRNQIYHSNFYGDGPGRCCVYTTCEPQYYVKECDVDGEPDVCVPCPPDSYLDDPTNSEMVYECIKKNCAEDTVPVNYPATKYDSSACTKRCACDTSRGFCGTDPCRCSLFTCLPGETLLRNCTCVSIAPSQPSPPPSSIAQGKDTALTAPPENSPTSRAATSPDTLEITRKTTVKPEKEDNSKNESDSTKSNTREITMALIIIILTFFGGVLLTVGVVWYKRPRTPRTVVNYSRVENNAVHNYKHCNIQQGNKNSMTVQNVNEEEEKQ